MAIVPVAQPSDKADEQNGRSASFQGAGHPHDMPDPSYPPAGSSSCVKARGLEEDHKNVSPAGVFFREIVLTPKGHPIIFDPNVTD